MSDAGAVDGGRVADAGLTPDAGPISDAAPNLDAGPGADAGADAAIRGASSIGEWVRDRQSVTASARAEAVEGGGRPCEGEDDTCLDTACEYAAGCLYVAEMTYVSTPAEGTDGPPLTIRAQYFQLAAEGELAGAAPVVLLNHGGRSLGTNTVAFALVLAARGYAVLASTYRGANGADGEVEGCLGEGDDVRILAELVRAGVPDASIAMVGGSHGGCVTLQALASGAPVDAAVALWPGTDGARRYRFNLSYAAADSDLTAARDRCQGDSSACCQRVRAEYGFVTQELVGRTMQAIGPLPDWETTPYTCDDPAFASSPDPWSGQDALQSTICARSPLARAASLSDTYTGPLLILHGERDPYIRYDEACEYARQAGGFVHRRIDDSGQWLAAGASTPCDGLTLDGGEPDATWVGDRHLVLIEPLGHGDTGRASATDACDDTSVASPDPNPLLFEFLEAKLGR